MNIEKLHLTEQQKNTAFKVVFWFVMFICTWAVISITLFKYCSITELFSPDRYYTRAVNLNPLNFGIRNCVLNIGLFFPVGFLIQMVSRKSRLSVYPVVISFAVSVVIEILQYVFSLGATDVSDVICNTLGGLIGALLYLLFNIVFKRNRVKANEVLLIVLGIYAVFQMFIMI